MCLSNYIILYIYCTDIIWFQYSARQDEHRAYLTDTTNSLIEPAGSKWTDLLSSPLLCEAKQICRYKAYLHYSLAEVFEELLDEDDFVPTDLNVTLTSEDKANVRNIYSWFAYTDPTDTFVSQSDSSDEE
jgi:hypothetical protein